MADYGRYAELYNHLLGITKAMATCAFCQKDATLTREHLWPAALHRRLMTANSQQANAFWLARLRRYIPSEPQIRDACETCNNVTLSELDSYICSLFDEYFIAMPNHGESVSFRFDYHRLKRWLLKMSFNSARIHDSPDLFALQSLRPYILGLDERLGSSVQLFLMLAYPETVAATELDPEAKSTDLILYKPEIHRTGHALFRPNATDQKLLRTVLLRAFHFYIAYWEPGKGRAEQTDFEITLRARWPAIRLLRPSTQITTLTCTGIGAWQAYKRATDGQFVFSDSDA